MLFTEELTDLLRLSHKSGSAADQQYSIKHIRENATTSHATAPAGCNTCLQTTSYTPSAFLLEESMWEQGTRMAFG